MYELIQHVSVLVTDLERARAFYTEQLQFTEDDTRPNFSIPGIWYQVGNTQIHLIVNPDGIARRNTTIIDSRDAHFAVRVKDMPAMIRRLEQNGIQYLDRPQNLTDWHQVYICDPDGNVIEFQALRQ